MEVKNSIMYSLLLLLIPHLTLSESGTENQLAVLKAQCDRDFTKNNYKKASGILSKIIKLEPDDYQNYYQRATAYFAMKKLDKAIVDLKTVVTMKPTFLAGYEFLAKSQMYICELKSAKPSLKKVISLANSEKIKEYKSTLNNIHSIETQISNIDSFSCNRFTTIKKISEVCQYYPPVLLKYADCLLQRKNYEELAKTANKLVKIEPNEMTGYLLLAQAYINQGKTKITMKVTKAGLKKDPEHSSLIQIHKKLSKINSLQSQISVAKSEKRTEDLVAKSELLLKLLPKKTFAITDVQLDLCEALTDLNKPKKAEKLCTKVIDYDKDSFRALKGRAKAFMAQKNYERASMDYKKVNSLNPNDHEAMRGFQEASRKAKAAEMKDYYKILDIRRNANQEQIKKAYKKAALKWHPDRWKKKKDKEEAQKKFKEINEANKVLSDPDLKRRYDSGENVYKDDGNSRGPNFGGGGFPFQFRDANGRTFFMHF